MSSRLPKRCQCRPHINEQIKLIRQTLRILTVRASPDISAHSTLNSINHIQHQTNQIKTKYIPHPFRFSDLLRSHSIPFHSGRRPSNFKNLTFDNASPPLTASNGKASHNDAVIDIADSLARCQFIKSSKARRSRSSLHSYSIKTRATALHCTALHCIL